MKKFSRRALLRSGFMSFALVLFSRRSLRASTRKLPHVFIIGDSISIGYTPVVKSLLEGKAVVSRPARNCQGTKLGVEKLDKWIGDGKYDLIHFNFGLHDMKHVDVHTGEGTNNPNDPVQSDLSTYRKNLEIIVNKLKKTGATLVFATTTPVPERSNLVLREPKQLKKYNRVALNVMKKHDIVINDLFGFATPLVKNIQKPNDVHYTPHGYQLLGEKVAEFISKTLHL